MAKSKDIRWSTGQREFAKQSGRELFAYGMDDHREQIICTCTVPVGMGGKLTLLCLEITRGKDPLAAVNEVFRVDATNDQQAGPAWHDRPTFPGRWLCNGNERAGVGRVVMNITAEEIATGVPHFSNRVYGPIPEDTQ